LDANTFNLDNNQHEKTLTDMLDAVYTQLNLILQISSKKHKDDSLFFHSSNYLFLISQAFEGPVKAFKSETPVPTQIPSHFKC
jgi:hypothetical protein